MVVVVVVVVVVAVIWLTDGAGRGGDGRCTRKEGKQPVQNNYRLLFAATP
jgi:hypothetical protein